jgi:hypothetical protein
MTAAAVADLTAAAVADMAAAAGIDRTSAARADEPPFTSFAVQNESDDALPIASTLATGAPLALDDKVLSSQRGGAAGFMMISAGGPLLMRGNGVTLWDEIAPPLPLPQPSDAARAAQGNNVTYVRK